MKSGNILFASERYSSNSCRDRRDGEHPKRHRGRPGRPGLNWRRRAVWVRGGTLQNILSSEERWAGLKHCGVRRELSHSRLYSRGASDGDHEARIGWQRTGMTAGQWRKVTRPEQGVLCWMGDNGVMECIRNFDSRGAGGHMNCENCGAFYAFAIPAAGLLPWLKWGLRSL